MMMMTLKSVSMNAAMNMMTINGRDVDSVQKMLRQLTYVNNRLFPTPAARPLTVETHVKYVVSIVLSVFCHIGLSETSSVLNLFTYFMNSFIYAFTHSLPNLLLYAFVHWSVFIVRTIHYNEDSDMTN